MKFTCLDDEKVRFSVLRLILISSILFIASCGGSSGGGDDSEGDVNADGFWNGSFKQNGITYNLSSVIYDNKFTGISTEAGTLYSGKVGVDGNKMKGTVDVLLIGGGFDRTTSVSATVIAKKTIEGSTSDASGKSTFSLDYDSLWDRDPDLATVAGTYLVTTGAYTFTMNVAADGTYTGSDTDGCVYSGTISPFDTTHNYYSLTMTVTATLPTCDEENDGTYTGTSFLDDFNEPNDVLALIIDDPSFILIIATLRVSEPLALKGNKQRL